MSLIRYSTFLLLAALWGCSPAPQQELERARRELARAYSAGAHQLAPVKYQEASTELRKGEELYRQGLYPQAAEVLPAATARAREARQAAKAERRQRATLAAEAPPSIAAPPATAPPKPPAPTAVRPQPSSPPPAKPSPPKPEATRPAPSPTRHVVGEGENLWTISARKEVYADALLWPLIYKANRDQIKDPRQIYPGQVLTIPREFTVAEQEEAREKARASQIFPVPPGNALQ